MCPHACALNQSLGLIENALRRPIGQALKGAVDLPRLRGRAYVEKHELGLWPGGRELKRILQRLEGLSRSIHNNQQLTHDGPIKPRAGSDQRHAASSPDDEQQNECN